MSHSHHFRRRFLLKGKRYVHHNRLRSNHRKRYLRIRTRRTRYGYGNKH